MVLTQRQRDELNQAIHQYLLISYQQSAQVFKVEAVVKDGQIEADLLEKKWNSIVRLSKRVITLEQQVEQLNEQLAQAQAGKLQFNISDDEQRLTPIEKFKLEGHRAGVNCIAFHPQYQILGSASDDGSIKLWDYESGHFEKTLKGHTSNVNCLAFDPTGKYICSASSDLSIKLWELKNHTCVKTLIGHEHSVSTVQFSDHGDFILSASRDKSIKLWEVQTGFCKKTFSEHQEWVRCAVFSNDEKQMASCSQDQMIYIWVIDSAQVLHQLSGHEHVVEQVKYIPEHGAKQILTQQQQQNIQTINLLVSVSRDKEIKIWNTISGTNLFTLSGHDNWVNGVSFHPDGIHMLSVSDDKTIRVWNLKEQKQKKKIENAHDKFILKCEINKFIFATCSVDQTIKLWLLS
ncbi:unnamed protein product [Paramecium sonneborni]|uniref:Lissencephaly-1 homolog n=1 Tax=Paramecium sonneborni TaxID=65129 RepID=A0A8S1MNC8_9CILI|nr:unnamed protein product [Paramecium sonneborni]